MRDRGFAFVEVALGLLVAAIVAAIVIMAVSSPNHDAAVRACQTEAQNFSSAVRVYHARHDDKAWPDTSAHGSVYAVSLALTIGSNLDSRNPIAHVDGSQRNPKTNARGWTYDFTNHTVDEAGCLDAT